MHLSLNGDWQLRWDDGERGDRLGTMLAGNANLGRAWTARVPGTVHETLVDHGVIADPNLGANVLACRWVEETVWRYRRTFTAPAPGPGERAWLVFASLDLAAVVHLNGGEVGRHANSFHPCRIEVTDHLAAGENVLVVTIESGLQYAMNRSAAGLGIPPHCELTKRPWLRKMQYEHGWDWSPRLLNVGIVGDVRLETATGVRWEQAAVVAELADDLATGMVTARVVAEGLGEAPVETTLTVTVGETRVVRPVIVEPGMNVLTATAVVPGVAPWWPVGHGDQPRYRVDVELAGAGQTSRTVGFRRVRVNQDPHPDGGRFFVIEVNGKPIFCKGGNFVPPDTIRSRITPARYAMVVDRALEANCNLLRIWGGGQYESDDFYDLCDARGVLVWQEFVFACAKYPATDEAFLADLKREAAYQVRRLAHHPSLVVWCGNNEMEWGNYQWGYERGVAHPDYALFHLVLPRIVKDEDGSRHYQPSSPFSPDHAPPNADHVGDQHPWSVGFGETDFRKYREMCCRFPNEGGILGPNALPTVRACTDRVGSFAWELHDNAVTYWPNAAYAPDKMVAAWVGREVEDMSIEDYVYWAGLVQGCGLAEYIRNFRRRMFGSAAAIFWMYNDVWPCTRSWTILDYYGRRTPAFWPVRRAFAPLTVVVVRATDTVCVYGVNDGDATTGELRCGVLALAGGYPVDRTATVVLPANASTVVAEFPADRWDELGVDTHVAFATLTVAGREVARDCLILPRYREMQWPTAAVDVQWQDGRAVFTSDVFAWRVCLDLDGERALPDNFFDVYPGIPTVLDWPAELGEPTVLRLGNG